MKKKLTLTISIIIIIAFVSTSFANVYWERGVQTQDYYNASIIDVNQSVQEYIETPYLIVYWGTSSRLNYYLHTANYLKTTVGGLSSEIPINRRHITTAWSLGSLVRTGNTFTSGTTTFATNTQGDDIKNILYSNIDIYAMDGVTLLRESDSRYDYEIGAGLDGDYYYANPYPYTVQIDVVNKNKIATNTHWINPTPLQYQGSRVLLLTENITLNSGQAIKFRDTTPHLGADIKIRVTLPKENEIPGMTSWSYYNRTDKMQEVSFLGIGEMVTLRVGQSGIPDSTHQVSTTVEYKRVIRPGTLITAFAFNNQTFKVRVENTDQNPNEIDEDPNAEAQILSPANMTKTILDNVIVKVKYTFNPLNPMNKLVLQGPQLSAVGSNMNLLGRHGTQKISTVKHSWNSVTETYLVLVPLRPEMGPQKIQAWIEKTPFFKSPISLANIERIQFIGTEEDPFTDSITGERIDTNTSAMMEEMGGQGWGQMIPNTDSQGNIIIKPDASMNNLISQLGIQSGNVQALFNTVLTSFPPEFMSIFLLGLTLAIAMRILGR